MLGEGIEIGLELGLFIIGVTVGLGSLFAPIAAGAWLVIEAGKRARGAWDVYRIKRLYRDAAQQERIEP